VEVICIHCLRAGTPNTRPD